jgi:ParB-like chromosome segregation protein Spo0J
MPATQIRNPEVDIDKIHVVDGFNSRRHFDPADLARMAETIKTDGIVEPLRVRQREDGEFDLVAGDWTDKFR